jgi:hypothetical protein
MPVTIVYQFRNYPIVILASRNYIPSSAARTWIARIKGSGFAYLIKMKIISMI